MSNKTELMAPAGSYEALMAGIKAGCDSVYFGVEQLNMRARSTNNFRTEDLEKIAKICSEHEVKSYLTLNTVMYDHDISLMKRIVDQAKASGITAIIASDHAVLNYAKKTGVEIHISTQANISNIDTVEFYSAYADVVVLARELSLKQVGDIVRQIQFREITGPKGKLIEVEIFAHGALCMAVSGSVISAFIPTMPPPTEEHVYRIAEEAISLLIKNPELNLKWTTNTSCRQKIFARLDSWTM